MKRAPRQDGSTPAGGSRGERIHAVKAEPQADKAAQEKTQSLTKELRKQAGTWLKELRRRAGLSQIELAQRLGFKYYTFVSQVENGFGRVPIESMEAWARVLSTDPAKFARELLSYYEPELHRLLFEVKK